MKIIGHRGASGYYPENTLTSFKKALEMGVDMIEFDVHALPSGEVVVMHDHRINRTTNGMGYVLNSSFADLRLLDAGGSDTVPTLEEVIELVDKRVPLNIELKGHKSAVAVADILKTYLQRGWDTDDFVVSSFNHHDLKHFKDLMPDINVAALMDAIPLNYSAFAEDLQAFAVCPGDGAISKEYVDDAHARGLDVYVWTINDAEEAERMYMLGVDGIFTNYPDITRKAIESFQSAAIAA
jgi:glycerophosphoryl diester phosphodiesterase